MNKPIKSIGAAIVIMLSSASHASILRFIDQNQPNHPDFLADFSEPVAQSFQQTNGTIAGAGIYVLPNFGTTATVTISLWNAAPHQAGSSMLMNPISGIATADTFFDVFWPPLNVTPGLTYFLEFTSVYGLLGIAGDGFNNPYAQGEAYAQVTEFSSFAPYPDADYAFRTYFAAPEPATLVLFGLGLAGLAFSRHRVKAC